MSVTAAELAEPRALAAEGRKNPFIVSPLFDGLFFFASAGVVLLAYVASAVFHVNGFYILAAVAIASNGPHLASTWTRVYLDRREWRKRPLRIALVPACIAAIVVTLMIQGQMRILNSILLYWATYHFLQQNWGLLRIYQKRSGELDTAFALRLERPLLYLSVAWCALHRLKTGPRALFGTEVFYPDLPWPALNALLAVTICLLGIYLIARARDGSLRQGATWLRIGFLGAAFMGFAVPFLLITQDGTSAFAAAACWHGFQYIGIVRFYHRNAWKAGVHPDARLMSWLSQPGPLRLFFYACLLWALAGAGFLVIQAGAYLTRGTLWTVETWGGATWLSLTFSHYYLDGIIWKLRKDKEMAARLLIRA
jgi:hypothetical protein